MVYQQTQHKILLWELIKPCTVFLVDIPTSLISHNHYNYYYEIFITFFCKLFDFLKKKINIKVFFLYFPPTLFLVFYKSYTYSTGLSMYLLVFLIVTLLPFFSFKKEGKISTHLKDAIPKSIGYSLFQRLVPPSPREKHFVSFQFSSSVFCVSFPLVKKLNESVCDTVAETPNLANATAVSDDCVQAARATLFPLC